MTPLSDVSVVIACHSELRWNSILEAVLSVNEQTVKPTELIVAVDHNSHLADRIAQSLPSVRVARNETSERGAGATRNVGGRSATTEFLAFLDDDEVADPTWLERLLEPFSDPHVVGTGGKYVPAWLSRRPPWFPDIFAWVVGAHHEGMPKYPARVRNVWSGNMAVRREQFTAVGGFKTNFGKVGKRSQPEDTEFCIRIARHMKGHWIYVPDSVIHHKVPSGRTTFRFFLERCYSEGHGKVLLKEVLTSPADDTLADESAYLRRDIPRSIQALVKRLPGTWSQIGAIICGIVASGVGALAAKVELRNRDDGQSRNVD